MPKNIDTIMLVTEIHDLYLNHTDNCHQRIEDFLTKKLKKYPQSLRIKILNEIIGHFQFTTSNKYNHFQNAEKTITNIASFLLGQKIDKSDLYSETIWNDLSCSIDKTRKITNDLNSILNDLFPDNYIASSETEKKPFNDNLLQIINGISITKKAFLNASRTRMKEMLDTLSPEYIETLLNSEEKNEPINKAESYNMYSEKYETIVKWLNSGVFVEALLSEYKNNCKLLLTAGNTKS